MQLVDVSEMALQMAPASSATARTTIGVGVVANRHLFLPDGLHRKHHNPTPGHDGSLLHASTNLELKRTREGRLAQGLHENLGCTCEGVCYRPRVS